MASGGDQNSVITWCWIRQYLGPLLEIWARSGWLSWPFWAEFHRVLVWLLTCQEEWFDCSRVGLIELA